MNLETIIGLEIHIQLKTKSKMFCGCSNNGENEPANTAICPICLGHPGTLPVANIAAVEKGVIMALALNCKINRKSIWARKNYFYPDLSKGYQISQFEIPLAQNGHLVISIKGEEKRIGIERLHLEEDAAKNFHTKAATLVDYNRGGTPLAEIVTNPDFRSEEEAGAFLRELRLIARYLDISDADMEKGNLRCDANISLRPIGEENLYPKTEIKNLNSFKAVEKALAYEIKRQTRLWNLGTPIKAQSTRGWNEKAEETCEQRDKEISADYRYFPEPDLPPLVFMQEQIKNLQAALPELPRQKRIRFVHEYGISPTEASVLASDIKVSDYFEKTMSEARAWLETTGDQLGTSEEIWQLNKQRLSKLVSGWLASELFKLMNRAKTGIFELKISPENFAEFIALIYEKKINSSSAQAVLKKMFETGANPSSIVEEEDLGQIDDAAAIDSAVAEIIAENPAQVEEYKKGKTPLIKYFIGLGMKEMKGKANPEKLNDIFKKYLNQ